jgi:hypothetical protein
VKDMPVKLDTLDTAEMLIQRNDFMMAFDLKNQFFHVKLHPDMQKYFGFALPDQQGVTKYYKFTVMVYGLKSAVHAVTKIIQPIKAYIHRHRVRFMIYIDDGRTFYQSKVIAARQFRWVLLVFQTAGWNIQWNKTSLEPTQ